MMKLRVNEVKAIFNAAEDGASAIRSIIPHYRVTEGDPEVNTFILQKTVQHFREHGKPDGLYRLGHGLELMLGDNSEILGEVPF